MSYLSPRTEYQYDDVYDFDEDGYQRQFTPTKNSSPASMVVPTIISALDMIASKENLLVISLAKSLITGAAGIFGGSAGGGLPGMALGAALAGGMLAASALKNKSLSDLLKGLSPAEQKQLADRVQRGLRQHKVQNFAAEVLQRPEVKDLAMRILSGFINEKFGLKIVNKR